MNYYSLLFQIQLSTIFQCRIVHFIHSRYNMCFYVHFLGYCNLVTGILILFYGWLNEDITHSKHIPNHHHLFINWCFNPVKSYIGIIWWTMSIVTRWLSTGYLACVIHWCNEWPRIDIRWNLFGVNSLEVREETGTCRNIIAVLSCGM